MAYANEQKDLSLQGAPSAILEVASPLLEAAAPLLEALKDGVATILEGHVNVSGDHDSRSQVGMHCGLGLMGLGGVGIVLYLWPSLFLLPVFVSLGLFLLGVGCFMSELSVSDKLEISLRGVTVVGPLSGAHFIAAFMRYFQAFIKRFVILFLTPNVQAKDVEAVMSARVLCEPLNAGVSAEKGTKRDEDGDRFHLALHWLQKPTLALGFHQQLWLHSLSLQAERGDAGAEAKAIAASAAVSPVARAKALGWLACGGLPQQQARSRLAKALDAADPFFAAAHPAPMQPFAAANSGQLLLQVLLRRLPAGLSEQLRSVQQGLLTLSASATLVCSLLIFALLRARRRTSTRLLAGVASGGAVGGVAASVYTWMLAFGISAKSPAAALVQRHHASLGEGLFKDRVEAAVQSPEGALAALARNFLRPRLSRPLLEEGTEN